MLALDDDLAIIARTEFEVLTGFLAAIPCKMLHIVCGPTQTAKIIEGQSPDNRVT